MKSRDIYRNRWSQKKGEVKRNKEGSSRRGGGKWSAKKSKEKRLRGKTRRQGGIKKRGRQKGKENSGEREVKVELCRQELSLRHNVL